MTARTAETTVLTTAATAVPTKGQLMRDHSNHIQISKEEAVAAILGVCKFEPAIEEVAIDQAIGRVLAEDSFAQLDMPNALTCRMDSIAVHWSDFENGLPDTSEWVRGENWQFANTGVAMPEGFDTAIVVEHCEFSDDDSKVTVSVAPSEKGAGTSAVGSKLKKGDLLVAKGATITPLLAAHIATGNNTTVKVVARPKVVFIPTGNELVPAGGEIPTGRNIETNSLLMCGKIAAWGGEPVIFDIVPDDPDEIEAALWRAASAGDIVVVNAGSSKGSDDFCIEVLEEIGEVLYHQTNHGPGHHSSAAVLDGTPVIGISGPPGGAAFTTDFYLRPAMDKFLGRDTDPVCVHARLNGEFPAGGRPKAKEQAVGEKRPKEPGEFYGIKQVLLDFDENGALVARPTEAGRPGPVEAEACAGYYFMPTSLDSEPPASGDMLEIYLRPDYWGNPA